MSGLFGWLSPGVLAVSAFALALAPAAHAEGRTRADSDAHALLAEIGQSALNVRVALSDARRAGNVARTRCVSRKLTEVHAQMRLANQHAASLAAARTKNVERLHRHVLEITRERARELAHEARSECGESQLAVRVIPPREGHVATR